MTADLKALLARVQVADGPDRELDAALTLWRHPELAEWPRTEIGGWLSPKWGRIAPAEHFTASLDAALALCERVLPGWFVGLQQNRHPEHSDWTAYLEQHTRDEVEATAPTPALALLAAMLKAKIAEAGSAAA